MLLGFRLVAIGETVRVYFSNNIMLLARRDMIRLVKKKLWFTLFLNPLNELQGFSMPYLSICLCLLLLHQQIKLFLKKLFFKVGEDKTDFSVVFQLTNCHQIHLYTDQIGKATNYLRFPTLLRSELSKVMSQNFSSMVF